MEKKNFLLESFAGAPTLPPYGPPLKYFNDSKAFIEYSNDMDVIYKNVENTIQIKSKKILIVLDDRIVDMLSISCFYHPILICCS